LENRAHLFFTIRVGYCGCADYLKIKWQIKIGTHRDKQEYNDLKLLGIQFVLFVAGVWGSKEQRGDAPC
jgi:hypothetical protein